MTTSANSTWESWPRAAEVGIDPDAIRIRLIDGRELRVPIEWFGFLAERSEAELRDVAIIGGGEGLWWETLDEGVSVPSLLGLPEDPPPDPSVRSYTVDYVPGDAGWLLEIRGTGFSGYGGTLASARRAARRILRGWYGARSLRAVGVTVEDVIHERAPTGVR